MAAPAQRRYGLANLLFAALYAWLAHVVAPTRSLPLALLLDGSSVLLALSGVALLVGWRGARRLAQLACGLVLLLALVLLAALVGAGAFLTAIYGPLGQGSGVLALLGAALVVQLFVLLPVAELLFLRERP